MQLFIATFKLILKNAYVLLLTSFEKVYSTMKTWLTDNFDIKHPIIMAPMFLVSNVKMLQAGARAGIMGCIPALNWRSPDEFKVAMEELKTSLKGKPFGVNLIVNKSNIHLERQIQICEEYKPDFIITSLGGPREVIKRLRPHGVKIFCDVTDLEYALKVQELGGDAIIAVNSGAGGHAGPLPPSVLVPQLVSKTKLPIISAGGVGTGAGLLSVLTLGACGVSIGSPFIATEESPVSKDYKDACVNYGANDIGLSTKLSGTPCTVIKTPYVEKIGLEQNAVEAFLNKNKSFKKYAKMLTAYKGMKLLEKAAMSATYKTVWCAGPSIEFINKVESVEQIVQRIATETEQAYKNLQAIHG
jgi:nitronate monooxygenase